MQRATLRTNRSKLVKNAEKTKKSCVLFTILGVLLYEQAFLYYKNRVAGDINFISFL